MSKVKLYTREQMIESFNYGQKLEGFDWIGDMIDSLDAIELPSDEEIEENVTCSNLGLGYPFSMNYGFIKGAKWMRDKIQGGNNE